VASVRKPRDDDRRRKILIACGAGALVIVLIVVAVVALGGGGGGKSGPEFKASTNVDLTVGEVKVFGVNPLKQIEFPPAIRDAVLSTLGTYVDNGIVNPLRKGKADNAALLTAFDAAAAPRLDGPDRAILVDEGLPKAVGAIKVTTPPVIMDALADRDGNIVLVTANVDLQVSSRAEKGTVKIRRLGSFVFAADANGAWKISGWTLSVTRTGPGVATAPTTAPPATAAPG